MRPELRDGTPVKWERFTSMDWVKDTPESTSCIVPRPLSVCGSDIQGGVVCTCLPEYECTHFLKAARCS